MEKINELIERSYQAIKKRGLITYKTTLDDFLKKIREELYEAEHENFLINNWKQTESLNPYIEEITDLMTVCIMQLRHLDLNPVDEFEKVVIKNEQRADKSHKI